jgi:hypothetical protein
MAAVAQAAAAPGVRAASTGSPAGRGGACITAASAEVHLDTENVSTAAAAEAHTEAVVASTAAAALVLTGPPAAFTAGDAAAAAGSPLQQLLLGPPGAALEAVKGVMTRCCGGAPHPKTAAAA